MKTFAQFMAEATGDLSKTAARLSKLADKADKENSIDAQIEAHQKASEAHRAARYFHQDSGNREAAMHHYSKENEHSKASLVLRGKKGAPPPLMDPRAKKFHWS